MRKVLDKRQTQSDNESPQTVYMYNNSAQMRNTHANPLLTTYRLTKDNIQTHYEEASTTNSRGKRVKTHRKSQIKRRRHQLRRYDST